MTTVTVPKKIWKTVGIFDDLAFARSVTRSAFYFQDNTRIMERGSKWVVEILKAAS